MQARRSGRLHAQLPLGVFQAGSPVAGQEDSPPDPRAAGRGAAERAAAWRAMLRSACEDLARVQSRAEELRAQRDAARADAQRWRQQYLATKASRDLLAARRDALVAALPGALSAMLANGCATAWEEGWRACQYQGADVRQNPYRADPEPAGSPAAARARCRAYLRYLAERRCGDPRS